MLSNFLNVGDMANCQSIRSYRSAAGRVAPPRNYVNTIFDNAVHLFFFKQKTAYEIGLGIPAEPLFRSRQNVGYSNFSQPQSHLSFCVLLQYLVERRRVVTQLGKLD